MSASLADVRDQAPANSDPARAGSDRLAEMACLREVSFAQIVRSITRGIE